MTPIDMRTLVTLFVVINAVCTVVALSLWWQSHTRVSGTAFWVAQLGSQGLATILIVLRGQIPDWTSVVLANTIAVAGCVLGLMGLERFVGRALHHWPYWLLVGVFAGVHWYFAFVTPDLGLRNLNFAVAVLLVFGQKAWLALWGSPPHLRRLTRFLGWVYVGFCVLSGLRISLYFLGPPAPTDYFQTGRLDAWVLLAYQVMLMLLTYVLVLMHNERFLIDIRAQEEKYATAFHSTPYAVLLTRFADGCVLEANMASQRLFGRPLAKIVGARTTDLGLWKDDVERDSFLQLARPAGHFSGRERTICTPEGGSFTGVISADTIVVNGESCLLATIDDITERKQAKEQQALAEEKLRVSQKMEAIGRLAGGIAHDFNNLLSVIVAYTELATASAGKAAQEDLSEIRRAAERATALTHRLLAFSRKPVLKAEPTNLSQVVTGLEPMLRRILGEDIKVTLELEDNLAPILAEPSQIEQVLMNLVVNARDAMPTGGALTIRTASVPVELGGGKTSADSPTLGLARLTVRDTGCGMSAETQAKLFEPFFTTKEVGKGTGLGLSTVYGIVQQFGGSIQVESAPGAGSAFEISFPQVGMAPLKAAAPVLSRADVVGQQTVLVVEDEDALRRLVHRILKTAGYTLLEAPNGEAAIALCQAYAGTIDLLLTDVVMPGMNGRELAMELTRARPQLKVLYMSGYTDDDILRHGVLVEGVHFLAKPFTPVELINKVTAVCHQDAPRASA